MTDFWVSNAKHFCNLCKVWCQGDPVSIKRHEEGPKHKDRVAARLKAARRKSQPSDEDVARQLREIEAAAAESMRQTAASGTFAGTLDVDPTVGVRPVRARPGIGPRPGEGWYKGDSTADFHDNFDAHSFRETRPAVREEDEDPGGEYVARGIKYFQGLAHRDKFVTRGLCELWVEATDKWLPAVVVQVKRFAAGDSEDRTYDVRLLVEPPELPSAGATRLERHLAAAARDNLVRDVNAKDLRVKADSDGVWRPRRTDDAKVDEARPFFRDQTPIEAPPPQVDQNTGIGQWTTVAVREFDEAKEEALRLDAEAKRESLRARREQVRQAESRHAADRARQLNAVEESRDALNSQLGVYDRTDVYRGIKLHADDDVFDAGSGATTEEHSAPDATQAVFKKRKKAPNSTAFRRKQQPQLQSTV